jgi:hypothetical protein
MTETPDTTTAPESADDGADDGLDLPQNLDQARKLRSENKMLRERLHTAETAATHLDNMRRAEVERLAGSELIDPADLWTAHPEVDGFLTDDGTIDPQRVSEAAQAITTAKPHLSVDNKKPPRPPSDRPIEGLRPGAMPDTQTAQPTWADALRR